MSSNTSSNLDAILAHYSEPNPTVWVSGDFPELQALAGWTVLDEPDELVGAALQVLDARTTAGRSAQITEPVCLLFDARSVAAATASEEAWSSLSDLARRGPDGGVHPVLARPGAVEDGVHGSDFAMLVRVLGDLRHRIDLDHEDIAAADPRYLATIFALRTPPPARLDAASAAAAGPRYSAPAESAPNRVLAAVRDVVTAAEGLWSAGLLNRARAMVTPSSGEQTVTVLFDEASAILGSASSASRTGGGKATWLNTLFSGSDRRPGGPLEAFGRMRAPLAQPDSVVWVYDPKQPSSTSWGLPGQVGRRDRPASGDEVFFTSLREELRQRGYSAAELAGLSDVDRARQLAGLDDAQPWHAVRVHFPNGRPAGAHAMEDEIRGRDRNNALANARWNWPDADRVDYLGHAYRVGDPVVDVEDRRRTGRITEVLPGPRLEDGPRLIARFDGEQQDTEVSRDRICFTGPDTAEPGDDR